MSGTGTTIGIETAKVLADKLVEVLKPYCTRIEVAGSIRRKVARVHDIDIVLIPDPTKGWEFYSVLRQLHAPLREKIITFHYGIAQVDLYIASEDNWATILLIRTGSKENNIRLCKAAQQKHMYLHADGTGLFDAKNDRIAGDTERSIYEALGEPYQEPEER